MSWVRHKLLDEGPSSSRRRDVAMRHQQQQQQQQQQQRSTQSRKRRQEREALLSASNRSYENSPQPLDEDSDEDERLGDWRQAAQMLTDDHDLYFQQQQQQQRPNSRQQQQQQQQAASKQQHNDNDDDHDDADDDGNSSISFAQSGCHSILSAWRIKAANKAARQAAATAAQKRPTSVLSNASSAGKRSAASTALTGFRSGSRFGAPAAQSRIALGPRSAQYLVTNSRRRRRANELIMSTLEARRRALLGESGLSGSRQNAASLLGSNFYLPEQLDLSQQHDNQLLYPVDHRHSAAHGGSLSPSPQPHFGGVNNIMQDNRQQQQKHQIMVNSATRGKTRSPSPLHQLQVGAPARHALSDLGTRRPSSAAQAQRERALRAAAAAAAANQQRHRPPPPLAKPDQNSSDLCSSNESSSSGNRSSSAGSNLSTQFTQLVSGELAPDCILLEAGHLSANQRQHREQAVAASTLSAATAAAADDEAGKLRRGALKRDSIRRLRLSRQQKEPPPSSSSVSSVDQHHQHQHERTSDSQQQIKRGRSQQQQQQQPVQVNRKSEIENNPFLNRHHFRSVSARQPKAGRDSRQLSVASGHHDDRDDAAGKRNAPTTTPKQRNSWLFSSARGQQKLPSEQQPIQQQQQRRRLMAMASSHDDNNREAINVSGGGGERVADGSISMPSGLRQQQQQRQPARGCGGHKENKQQPLAASPREQTRPVGDLDRFHHHQAHPRATTPTKTSAEHNAEQTRGQLAASARRNLSSREQQQSEDARATGNKIVREGAKSSDDLKFDLMGNRRQYEINERWRYEKEASRTGAPIRRQLEVDDKGRRLERISQERLFSERIEVLRSSSISPPVGFADSPASRGEKWPTSAGSRNFVSPTSPSGSPSPTASANQQPPATKTRRALSEERPAKPRRAAPIEQPATSATPAERFRPQVAPRTRGISAATATSATTTTVSPERRPQAAARVQAELPKFEQSADDEFRKRVDYLRKLARANLDSPVATKDNKPSQPTTKPMSTNWRATDETPLRSEKAPSLLQLTPKARTTTAETKSGSLFDERAEWNLGPFAGNQRGRVGSPTAAAVTNLDLAIRSGMADKENYLSGGPAQAASSGFQWRRSNSSLASVGASKRQHEGATSQTAPTPRLPALRSAYPATMQSDRLRTSQSNLSTLSSNSQQHPEVMKLLVSEKCAPKLNYAFVEKQQQEQPEVVPQRQQPVASALIVPPPRAQPRPAQAKAQQVQQQGEPEVKVLQTSTTSSSTTLRQSSQLESITTRSRSPVTTAPANRAVTSPRSPEFGPQATSSNDDSAIASSVSSPSLSYMLQIQQQQQQQQQTTNQPVKAPLNPVTEAKRAPPARPPPPTRPAQSQPAAQQLPSQQESAAHQQVTPQSILRRQQQQQQLRQQQPEAELSFEQQREARLRKFEQDCSAAAAAASESSHSDSPLQGFHHQQRALSPLIQEEAQQQQQPASTSARRVTFNDRTSVRSFESISSLASNSTAVPASDMMLRQQLGSPDSMGSGGSSSRLSGESPDPSRRYHLLQRQQQQQLGGGAAIYAIRDDPELDSPAGEPSQPLRHQQYNPTQMQTHQQHQQQQRQFQMPMPPTGNSVQPATASRPGPMVQSPMLLPSHHLLQHQQPFLRMTAPPRINMHQHQQQPMQQQQQQLQQQQLQQYQQRGPMQYLVRPTSSMSTQISPIQNRQSVVSQLDDDSEEPDYALRLRQAATSRVFANYVQPASVVAPPPPPPLQQMMPHQHQPTLMHHHHHQQQVQPAPQRRRPTMEELLSYQTEV